jgi:hypothetical protein
VRGLSYEANPHSGEIELTFDTGIISRLSLTT